MDVGLREDALDGPVLGREAPVPAGELLEDLDGLADLEGEAELGVALPVVDGWEKCKFARSKKRQPWPS